MAPGVARHAARAFWAALKDMAAHETPGLAATISYFTLFALFPALIALGGLADALLGWMHLHDQVLESALALFPGSRPALAENLAHLAAPSPLVTVSCLGITLWSSAWVLMYVETALNRAWGVLRRRTFWQSRLRSLGLLALAGILLLGAAMVTVAVSAIRSLTAERLPERADPILDWLGSSLLLGLGCAAAFLVFLMVYKLMPDRRVRWVEAASGALLATVLWEGASYVFAKLVPWFDYERIYGKMGALVAVMSWVYISTFILLAGAHFAAQLHRRDHGRPDRLRRRVQPEPPRRSGSLRVFTGR